MASVRSINNKDAGADKEVDAVNNVPAIHQNPEGFWQFRPFSRITNWGKDFKQCIGYLKQNFLEAFGFVNYKPRKNHYAAWIKHAAPIFCSG